MPLKFLSANLGSSRFYFFNKTNPKFAFLTFSPTSGPKLSLLSLAIPYPATPSSIVTNLHTTEDATFHES